MPGRRAGPLPAASLVLRRYGLNLAAAFDQEAGHDVLMARTVPRIKTSYYRGGVRILVFESLTAGAPAAR